MCPEEYIDKMIEDTDLHNDEKFFLIEVFSGALQYNKVLDELLSKFGGYLAEMIISLNGKLMKILNKKKRKLKIKKTKIK